jgi:N-acetylneuraminic acid mutarotase
MNRTSLASVIILSLSMLIIALPGPAHAAPQNINWTTGASMPKPEGQAAVVTGPDGRIYLMGGFAGGVANNTAFAYNPITNIWSSLPNMPVATRGAVAAVAPNGLIYMVGGFNNTGHVTTNQAYNITSNTWTEKQALPTGVWEAAAATGNDGKIYIFGGEGGPGLVQIYNPSTDTWSTGTPVPGTIDHEKAVKSNSGIIYVIAGFNTTTFSAIATVEAYNPASNSWSTVSSMPEAKSSFGATIGPDGLIYVFGGSTTNGNDQAPYLNSVEVYDPGANQWYNYGNTLPTARRELSAATGPNGKMYLLGGANGGYLTTNEVATIVDQPPTASITSITATPVTRGTAITFTGSGSDSDGTIIAYKWRSSINGTIGNSASFAISTLGVGTHTIYFSVEDNAGQWSPEATAVVTVNATPTPPTPISSDPIYQAVQTTMLILYVTLAAAIAAVVISIYNLMSRKKTPPSPAHP